MDQGSGIVSQVIAWLRHPFSSGGSAFGWLMFVGLLVIAAWFWNHVLLELTEEI